MDAGVGCALWFAACVCPREDSAPPSAGARDIAGALPLAAASTGEVLLWGGAMVVLVAALGVVLLLLRRRYHPAYDPADDDPAGFSIEELELLRREGSISEDEFRRLRRLALGLDAPADRDNNRASSVAEQDDDG